MSLIKNKILFNGFWPDFMKKDPINYTFFIYLFDNIFKNNYIITWNFNDANILIETYFGKSLLNDKNWKLSIFFSGERHLINNFQNYNIILGPISNSLNTILPLYIPYLYCNPDLDIIPINKNPINKICAVISNGDSKVRNTMINRLLKEGIQIDMGGKYLNNIGEFITGSYNGTKILEFYNKYKIVLAFENTVIDDYITEKILNPIKANTIPLYFGARNVTKYINKNRIIIVDDQDEKKFQETINLIKDILYNDYDNKKWLNIINNDIQLKYDNILDNIVTTIKNVI